MPESCIRTTRVLRAFPSFRAWYHNGRWKLTRDLVDSFFHPGSLIYDFGSGGSEWNANHLPVIGVDANRQLLEHGVSTGKLESFVVSELWNAPLPDESADAGFPVPEQHIAQRTMKSV